MSERVELLACVLVLIVWGESVTVKQLGESLLVEFQFLICLRALLLSGSIRLTLFADMLSRSRTRSLKLCCRRRSDAARAKCVTETDTESESQSVGDSVGNCCKKSFTFYVCVTCVCEYVLYCYVCVLVFFIAFSLMNVSLLLL